MFVNGACKNSGIAYPVTKIDRQVSTFAMRKERIGPYVSRQDWIVGFGMER
jgi:hypothetical protein